MRFSRCERIAARTSHHLNVAQLRRASESFAYKSLGIAFRPSDYQRQGRGLHQKPLTYRPCKTVSQGVTALEQGLPPTAPYKDYRL
jgi:hypothetical protein